MKVINLDEEFDSKEAMLEAAREAAEDSATPKKYRLRERDNLAHVISWTDRSFDSYNQGPLERKVKAQIPVREVRGWDEF